MGLQPGEIIEGKYRIVRLIGESGMGAVYEGENTRIKRRVAIKVLHAQVAEKTDVVQRFEREAQAAGRIGSEHIVEVLDLGNLPSGERFMVMEFLHGEDLTSRIKRHKRLRPHESIPILHQVLEGLAAAHEAGIIHRDLKPDNIFLLKSKAGRADFVKLLDFGVSKFSTLDADMAQTRAGAVMGTPYYMSPEQAKGGTIDNRSDLYAVGVVLYQMSTGRVPFNAGSFNELLFKIALETPEPVEKVVPDMPASFAQLINKAMSRSPEGRFQTAKEYQEALAEWQLNAPPPGRQDKTEPLPAMPDLTSPSQLMGPVPTPTGGPGPTPTPTGPGPTPTPTGQGSFPTVPGAPGAMPTPTGASSMMQSGGYPGPGGAAPGMTASMSSGTPIPGSLASSQQVALSVTKSQASRRNTVVALAVVGLFIVSAGTVGVYLAMSPGPIGAAAQPDSDTAAESAAGGGGSEGPGADPEATADEAAEATASTDVTAEPEDTAGQIASAEPTAEETAEPEAVAKPSYPEPSRPSAPSTPTRPSKPRETDKPKGKKAGGRQISTEL